MEDFTATVPIECWQGDPSGQAPVLWPRTECCSHARIESRLDPHCTPSPTDVWLHLCIKMLPEWVRPAKSLQEEKNMKRIVFAMVVLVLTAGLAGAGGGKCQNKHQSDIGKGSVATGSTAKGNASQTRLGK